MINKAPRSIKNQGAVAAEIGRVAAGKA